MELATFRRVRGRRNIAGEDNAVHLHVRIGHGYCGEQRFRVRVHRIVEDFVGVAQFHHISEVHNQNLIGNVFDDG